jgi:hypothetical protein
VVIHYGSFLAAAAIIATVLTGAANTDRPGEWLQFRRDRALTGRCPLKGDITSPAILWRRFIGARETLLGVRFGSGAKTVPLPAQDVIPDSRRDLFREWSLGGPWYDLDGDGRQQAVGPGASYKIGRFLPGIPGLQKVEFESGFEKAGTSADSSVPIYGRLYARRNGEWAQVWQTEPIPLLYSANAIVGDFDGDGRLEVALVPWYDLWVLDIATGRLKAKCRFTPPGAESGRAYGWLGAYDLDGDGRQEFVILSDFENHMEVLGWKDGRLEMLWSRLIERGITRKNTVLRPGVDPVQDMDGDGRPEIVISLFNAAGDGRWHVVALDGMTGKPKLDLPGQYLVGLRDLDGDGVSELFCAAAPGLLVPEPSELSVLSFKNGRLATRWRQASAAFQTQPVQDFPPNVNSGAGTGRLTLLAGPVAPGGRPVFFTRRLVNPVSGLVELTAWQADGRGGIVRAGSLTGPYLEAVATQPAGSGEPGILIRAQVPGDGKASLRCAGAAAQPLLSRRVGAPTSTAVVGRLKPGAPPTVVVQGACETVEAFRVNPTPTLPFVRGGKRIWRATGRGICVGDVKQGGGAPFGGVVLADLRGDGNLAALYASYGKGGCARLVAAAPDGKELWHHDFERFPGAPPVWNVGGLTMWFAGHFTDARRCDVMVSLRRSTMHSDETFLLDGRDGKEIWHRTEGGDALGTRRGCGGAWAAVCDYDGDGLDDAVCLYPDVVFVMRGADGKLLLDKHTSVVFGSSTYYALPVVMDFLGNGKRQMLYGACSYMLALLDMGAGVLWKEGPSSGTPAVLPGIGDADGDGRLELLSPGHGKTPGTGEQEFRCYDAATGRLKWTLRLPGSCFSPNGGFYSGTPTATATADLDSDGREECVFAAGSTLYAVGANRDGTAGEVKWKFEMPGSLGPPVIADTTGSGRPEIVVVCGDGYVYGIGQGGR